MEPIEQQAGKFQIRLPLILAATLAAGMFIGQQLPHYDQNIRLSGGSKRGSGTLDEILRYVSSKYVDTVNTASLRDEAIEHLLSKLDPHSVYISPDELKAVEDDMSGGFEGVGIEFIMIDDTMQVVTPLAGGPSEAAGILAGDKIVSINDTAIAGVKIDNGMIYKKLRGNKGSTVKLGILRGAETTQRFFNIVRAVIPVNSVDIAYMLDEHTGYLKINRFTDNTRQEFMEGLRPLAQEKGLQNLVIDLRGNPGGYLEEATDILSQIFPDGKLLVYTKGRAEQRKEYKSNGHARFNIQNVAVLIDEGSASASEILAGAVQDWDRGWIIGRRSYGKGLVQEQYPLSDGGAIRLTIARYYTPSGRCIQRDYKHDEDYAHDVDRRLKNGELSDASKTKLADTTKYYTGFGRIVYGGGGITPDVFIPLDTSFSSEYFMALRQQLTQFSTRWMEGRDRKTLPANLNEFVRSWSASDAMVEELVAYGEKQGVKREPLPLAKCYNELKLQLKARVAKSLFGDIGLYTVVNDDDPAVEKALHLLKTSAPVAKQ
jgi:carboxyl-terminal processing protease